jgi:lysophospholipase L1-like esterase
MNILFSGFLILLYFINDNSFTADKPMEKWTYLALGDSYTIGEGVDPEYRYPNQLAALLNQTGILVEEPKIIAKTGWTTDELEAGIAVSGIQGKQYDLVTVLIGVNNQYRGRALEEYRKQLGILLESAIAFAGGNKEKVLVLSIPDWGVTPFALNRGVDQAKVAGEIDAFNAVKEETALSLDLKFIDITTHYRKSGNGDQMVVADRLHPSKEVYAYWAAAALKILIDKE